MSLGRRVNDVGQPTLSVHRTEQYWQSGVVVYYKARLGWTLGDQSLSYHVTWTLEIVTRIVHRRAERTRYIMQAFVSAVMNDSADKIVYGS